MSQQIPRTAYFSQSGILTIPAGVFSLAASTGFLLPISSANVEVTRPLEPITSFGQFNSVNNVQVGLTTCKSTIKSYLGSGAGGMQGVTADLLNFIVAANQTGYGIGINVSPNAFAMSGICDNIGIDIAMGGLATCDLGIAGIGYPITLSNPANVSITTTALQATGLFISPVTTMSVNTFSSGINTGIAFGGTGTVSYGTTPVLNAMSGIYANSIKFSYSLPTDVLSALGDNPNAQQGNLVSVMASKPPYKATIMIEGHGVNPSTGTPLNGQIIDAIANAVFTIGNIGIQLPNGKVSARSFSNAAGQIAATYSATIEDVSAVFYDIALSGYSNTGANISSFGPSFGG